HAATTRVLDRVDHGLFVERHERAQVDDLDAATLLRRLPRGLFADRDHRAVTQHRDVGAFARDAGLAERYHVFAERHLALAVPVDALWLEEHDRGLVADRCDQEALRVGRRARDHDLEPRRVAEVGLARLAVVVAAADAAAIRRTDHER